MDFQAHPYAPAIMKAESEDGWAIGSADWHEARNISNRTGNRARYVQTVRTEMGDKMEYDKRGIYAVWQAEPGQEKRLDHFTNQEVAGGPGFYYYEPLQKKYIHTHEEIPPGGIKPRRIKAEPPP